MKKIKKADLDDLKNHVKILSAIHSLSGVVLTKNVDKQKVIDALKLLNSLEEGLLKSEILQKCLGKEYSYG